MTEKDTKHRDRGMLVIWNDIDAECEDEFLRWHILEHIPERVGLPGFVRGQRYIGIGGSKPAYFNFYETTQVGDLSSDAYRTRLNNPTEWTRRVVSHFQNTARTICRKAASAGIGDGAFAMTLRLSAVHPADTIRVKGTELIKLIVREPGIVAAHLLEGQPEASAGASTEKTLRKQADEIAAWVILIEAVEEQHLVALTDGAASKSALQTVGFGSDIHRGCYRVQFTLRHEFAYGHVPDPKRSWL